MSSADNHGPLVKWALSAAVGMARNFGSAVNWSAIRRSRHPWAKRLKRGRRRNFQRKKAWGGIWITIAASWGRAPVHTSGWIDDRGDVEAHNSIPASRAIRFARPGLSSRSQPSRSAGHQSASHGYVEDPDVCFRLPTLFSHHFQYAGDCFANVGHQLGNGLTEKSVGRYLDYYRHLMGTCPCSHQRVD